MMALAASNPVTAAVLAVLAIDAATGGTIGGGIQHAWDTLTGNGHYVQSKGYANLSFDAGGNSLGNKLVDYGHGFNPQNMVESAQAKEFAGNLAWWYGDMATNLGLDRKATTFGFSLNDTGSAVIVGGLMGGNMYISPEVMPGDYHDAARHAVYQALLGSAYNGDQMATLQGLFPGFANGGLFGGGMRLVGERGPELEITGPSRIFDAQTTASMLRSGGASNDELVTEMRLLREAFEQQGDMHVTVVTESGRVIAQETINQIRERSAKGELVIYATGVK
jgi:hypothetical protein